MDGYSSGAHGSSIPALSSSFAVTSGGGGFAAQWAAASANGSAVVESVDRSLGHLVFGDKCILR